MQNAYHMVTMATPHSCQRQNLGDYLDTTTRRGTQFVPWDHIVNSTGSTADMTPGPCFNIKTVFSGMGIPIIKLRWHDHIVFVLGIHTLIRWHLYIRQSHDRLILLWKFVCIFMLKWSNYLCFLLQSIPVMNMVTHKIMNEIVEQYMSEVMEVELSSYLVLLPTDSKTR